MPPRALRSLLACALIGLAGGHRARAEEPGRNPGPETVVLRPETPRTPLGPSSWYLADPQGQRSPEGALAEARAGKFSPLGAQVRGLPGGRGHLWLYVVLEAPDAGTWYVTWHQPVVEGLDAWWWGAGASGERHGGLAVPRPERSIELTGPHHRFPLTLGAGERLELLVRVSTARTPIVELTAWSGAGLTRTNTWIAAAAGAEGGMLVLVVVLSLASWLLLGDRRGLRLAGVMASFGAYLASVSGLAATWVWPDSPRWALAAPPFLAVCTGALALGFARSFVESRNFHARLDRLARGLTWWLVATAAFELAAPFTGASGLALVASAIPSGLSFPVVVALGVAAARRGDPTARWFLAAWVVMAVTGVVYTGAVLGLLPATPVTLNGLQPAVLLGALSLFLSWALRVEAERRDARGVLERQRDEAQERFRLAFTTSPDAINITRLADGVYVAVNEGFLRLTGWREADVLGHSALELNIWADPADRARLVAGLKTTGRVENLEAVFLGRDRRRITGLMSAALVQLGDEPHLLSVTRDISDRKAAEAEHERLTERLQQSQKLEAVGRLAGGVAHDFNNLLTAITTNTSLALLDLPAGDPSRESFEEIQDASARAARLTRQLLAFSRRQVIEPRALDLSAHVAGLAVMLRRLLGEDVDLVLEVPPGAPLVMADPGQVEQVVVNLAVNARDALGPGGRITIGVATLVVGEDAPGERRPGRYGAVVVRDDGAGIAPDLLANIFEPCFTTKAGKGTGLGLSTVYGIARQHGGFVDVESGPGKGTVFRVAFPAAAAGVRAVPQVRAAELGAVPAGGGETILLAEDEPSVREVTRVLLERLGYRVLAAADGEAAEALADAHPGAIDLLLTDVVMPRRNGRELAERLLARQPNLAVVFMSGYTQDVVDRAGVLEAGVVLVQKPFEPARLAAALRAALARRQAPRTG